MKIINNGKKIVIFISVILLIAVIIFYNTKILKITKEYNEKLILYDEKTDKEQNQITRIIDLEMNKYLLQTSMKQMEKQIKEATKEYEKYEKEISQLNIEIRKLRGANDKLNKDANEWQEKYYVIEEIQSKLTAQGNEWQIYYKDDGFYNYWTLSGINGPMYAPVGTDKEYIDFIVKHFKALFSGDWETFQETLSTGWYYERFEELCHYYAEENYYRAEVKLITHPGPGWNYVYVAVQKEEDSNPDRAGIYEFPVAIRYSDGVCVVYDYH